MKRSKPRTKPQRATHAADFKSLSHSKSARQELVWSQYVPSQPDNAFMPYTLQTRFADGSLIAHPKFGKGVVVAVGATNVDVLFADCKRKLAHGVV